ncbi:hypothetical protein BH10ACI2_BH10ACI2_19070 [soil metagenome]
MNDRSINLLVFLLISATFVISAAAANSATFHDESFNAVPQPTPVSEKPPYTGYKDVTIGMAAEIVRTKLGAPKEKSDEQDSFVFSDHESAQVYYDSAKKVTAVTVTFTGKIDTAPTPAAVFGVDAEVNPDGGIFKMVRYPKAGFWISYNKIPGAEPMIMIALQKI